MIGFPRLYAAASLKPTPHGNSGAAYHGFPRLYAAASLKQLPPRAPPRHRRDRFPRLYAAASLKPAALAGEPRLLLRFPRLYAAASLKRRRVARELDRGVAFSAALCRGLIEASRRTSR